MRPSRIMVIMGILLAVTIGASFCTKYYLAKSSRQLENHIVQIEGNMKAGNWDRTQEGLMNIEKDWSKTERAWGMLIDHFEIDNIDNSLSRMSRLIEIKNKSLALTEAANLKQYIKHIPERESFLLKNLF